MAITEVLLDGGLQRPSGLPHYGTHTRKCALNFETIGTLIRPQPSATIRICNRQQLAVLTVICPSPESNSQHFSDNRRLGAQSRAGFAFAIARWTRENISFLDRSSTSALDRLIYAYRCHPANSGISINPVTTLYASRLVRPYESSASMPTDTDRTIARSEQGSTFLFGVFFDQRLDDSYRNGFVETEINVSRG
jgi:hypothetical protein